MMQRMYMRGFVALIAGVVVFAFAMTAEASHSWGGYSNDKNGNSDCSNLQITNGGEATCTITNDDKPAQLTIVKHTDEASGDGTFNFTVTGIGTPITLHTEDGSATGETLDLNAGSYDVSELSPGGGWNLADVSCAYDEGGIGTSIEGGEHITVDNGDSVTCTFTNTKQGTLIVKKVVVNDNGGAATAHDFLFKIDGGGATAFESDGQNNVVVAPGTHSVTEVAADGYTTAYDNCTDIEVSAGGEATCTITNDDIAPTPTETTQTTSNIGNGPPPIGPEGFGFFGQVPGARTSTVSGGEVLGASTSSCSALLTQVPMAQGLANDAAQVKALQGFLNGEVNAGLPTTGFFGPLTKAAVSTFQLKYWQEVLAPWVPFGLPTDHTATGWIGKTTAWKANMLYCPSLSLPFPQVP